MPFNPNFKLGRKKDTGDDLEPDIDDYVEEKPKSSRKKSTKSEKEKTDSVKVNYRSNSLVCEITILITGAICVILFLSNFNLTGKVGVFLNQIMLGLFGFAGWMVPVFLFAGVWYILYHKTNTFVKLRIAGVIVVFVMFCGICQLISMGIYNPQTSILDYYNQSIDGSGGGLVGGLLCMALYPTFGKAGAYIILMVTIIIGFILITGKSFLNALKNDIISLGMLIREYFDTKDEEEQQIQEQMQEKRVQRIEQRNVREPIQSLDRDEADGVAQTTRKRRSSARRRQTVNNEPDMFTQEPERARREPNVNINNGVSFDEVQDDVVSEPIDEESNSLNTSPYADISEDFSIRNDDYNHDYSKMDSNFQNNEPISLDVVSGVVEDSNSELEEDIKPVHKGLNETFMKFFSKKLVKPNFKKHDSNTEENSNDDDVIETIDVENVDEIKKVSNYKQLQISSIDSTATEDFSYDNDENTSFDDDDDSLTNNYQSLNEADDFTENIESDDEDIDEDIIEDTQNNIEDNDDIEQISNDSEDIEENEENEENNDYVEDIDSDTSFSNMFSNNDFSETPSSNDDFMDLVEDDGSEELQADNLSESDSDDSEDNDDISDNQDISLNIIKNDDISDNQDNNDLDDSDNNVHEADNKLLDDNETINTARDSINKKLNQINLFGTTPLNSIVNKESEDNISDNNEISHLSNNSDMDNDSNNKNDGDYRTVVTSSGKVINVELDSMPGAKKVRPAKKNLDESLEKVNIAIKSDKEAAKSYVFPTTNLLTRGRTGKSQGKLNYELKETAKKLEDTLRNFGVGVTVNNISCGPAVTRYELQPEQGVKVSKIIALTDDIKLNLAAADIRIEAPIPGKAAIGIEVPNKENRTVLLRDILESDEFKNHPSKLAFAVGKDIGGQTIVADITTMPHLLIAGATGSGKSVCINTLIMSILYKSNPVDVRLMMIDPKVVELSVYNGVPHLLIPVVTDPKKAASALNWAVTEMTERYKKFADLNVRDISGYNSKIEASNAKHPNEENVPSMPQIVIIVDELADLMMVAPSEVEDAICRLAQMARAAGIHLVIATQRPSVNVITGIIKANIPSRIAFAVSSGVDSRTIIDMNGAEKLLGRGDMLFYPYEYQKPVRVQGAFISDKEVANVVQFLSKQKKLEGGLVDFSKKVTSSIESSSESAVPSDKDPYFEQAARLIVEKDKASIGMLQRVFRIGFNRAARIMDQLASYGIVGDEEGTKARKILVNKEELESLLKEQ